MAAHPDYLTASDYYKYLQCPHWPYYERYATPAERKLKREFSAGELQRLENGLGHERDIINKLLQTETVKEVAFTGDPEADAAVTLSLMKQGVPYIYQGTLTHDDWTGRPDLLRRIEGESSLGDWLYVPVDVKSAHAVEKYHRLQLMFYAVLLEHAQGCFPGRGYIINKDGEEYEVELGEQVSEFESLTQDLERIRVGEKPDPVLRKTCFDTGPWGAACQQYAETTHDIALLFNVDVKKLRALRELKIRTLEDAAEMDVVDLDGRAKGLRTHGLEVAKLQAQSLLHRQVIVREPVAAQAPPIEIHFDIESDPPSDTDYLFGCLVRAPQGTVYKPFIAERLEDEEKMWREFLDWISTLTMQYQVVHYASYEMVRLAVLERRYGGSPALDLFRERMIDLKQIVTSSVVFPQYFYGLKYLAKFLGFSWRSDVQSGGASVDAFEKYLATGDKNILEQIVLYNEDDVRATARLMDWCRAYALTRTAYDKPYPWEKGIPSVYGD